MADGHKSDTSDIVAKDMTSGELYPIKSDVSELKYLLLKGHHLT